MATGFGSQRFEIIFANSALVGAALIRLRGGDPTVGDGFRIALQRIGVILAYAPMSATVGMILRAISELPRMSHRTHSVLGLGRLTRVVPYTQWLGGIKLYAGG